MRVELPFIGPYYTNREKQLSAQITKNLFPQIDVEARNKVSLHNTAGLGTFATLEGVDRGTHDFNNLMYAVNGSTLYSIDADGVNTALGTIAGTDRCVMANDSIQLIIVTGDTPYRYTVSGGVEAITDEDLVKPTSVAYLNSQFLFDQNAGVFGEFVTSSIQAGLSVDALDFAQAESHPDDIIRILAFRNFAYMFGSHSVEPWANIGKGNPPWAVVKSGVQPYGLAGTHGVVATSEYMYFLDNKRIPRRSQGLDFANIGNPALGVEFAKYSKIDDVIAFEFTQDNQQFFALTFPTANRTWCFHEPSGTWFQLSYGIDDDRHRASSMLNIYGLNYCADHTNGLLYEYSLDIHTDNGKAIIRQRDTAPIHGGLFEVPGKKLFYNMVEFVIASGETEVAGTGLGPQPVVPDVGLCGTSADLTQGQLMNIGPIAQTDDNTTMLEIADPIGEGLSFNNTQIASFTCGFMRENAPDSGLNVHAIGIHSSSDGTNHFEFYMDGNGYMNIRGRNEDATLILDAQITNNGGSFADSGLHMFSCVIDLSDSTRREIYHNHVNITESTWITWNTYLDDVLQIADTGADPTNMVYNFGFDTISGKKWSATGTYNGTGYANGIDALGYVSFDDQCSLIASSVWDNNGYVRDPQKWEGWYKSQPQVFFGPSFWRNTGKTEPLTYAANSFELTFDANHQYVPSSSTAIYQQSANSLINLGIGGTTSAAGSDALPAAPPADPQTEITAPFWLSSGNWIDVTKLTNTSYEAMFGVTIEGADFNKVVAVNKAASVNTADSGNRIQVQDSADCANAALYVVDASGNVKDSMIYSGVPSGDSVLVPTGSNYFIVIASDSGNAKIKKWDSSTISTVGSTSWLSYYGRDFILDSARGSWVNIKTIPTAGISLAFTIPVTTKSYKVSFSVPLLTQVPGTVTGSINQTVGDYTSVPTHTWGLGGGLVGGINLSGQDIDLVPGATYFFSARNNSPLQSNNKININVTYEEV